MARRAASLVLLCLLAAQSTAGRRLPLNHLHLDRSFLVVVLGQTHGRHNEPGSLYNLSNLEEHVLAPLARLSAYPVHTLDCSGESLAGLEFGCAETSGTAADQWVRFAQCGVCVQRLLAGESPATHVVRVRPDVTFWSDVQHEDLPPFGFVAARVRAALGWTNITNAHFSYHWGNTECDTSQAVRAGMHSPDASAF